MLRHNSDAGAVMLESAIACVLVMIIVILSVNTAIALHRYLQLASASSSVSRMMAVELGKSGSNNNQICSAHTITPALQNKITAALAKYGFRYTDLNYNFPDTFELQVTVSTNLAWFGTLSITSNQPLENDLDCSQIVL